MWTETLQLTVVQGAFSAYLGEQNTGLGELIRQGRAQYIGVSINNESELPRQKLGAQPYALMSYNSLRLDGVSLDELARSTQLDELRVDVDAAQSAADSAISLSGEAQASAAGAAQAAATAQSTAEARTTEAQV
jgi:hypothetical protein